MNVDHTPRGFEIIRFADRNGLECRLQQSSLAQYEPPGTSAIWFGFGDNPMHIDLAMLKELIPHLQRWVDEGTFVLPEPVEGERSTTRIAELEAELNDWKTGYENTLSERCPHDERHCTCVPHLRKRIAELEEADRRSTALLAGLDGLLQNERDSIAALKAELVQLKTAPMPLDKVGLHRWREAFPDMTPEQAAKYTAALEIVASLAKHELVERQRLLGILHEQERLLAANGAYVDEQAAALKVAREGFERVVEHNKQLLEGRVTARLTPEQNADRYEHIINEYKARITAFDAEAQAAREDAARLRLENANLKSAADEAVAAAATAQANYRDLQDETGRLTFRIEHFESDRKEMAAAIRVDTLEVVAVEKLFEDWEKASQTAEKLRGQLEKSEVALSDAKRDIARLKGAAVTAEMAAEARYQELLSTYAWTMFLNGNKSTWPTHNERSVEVIEQYDSHYFTHPSVTEGFNFIKHATSYPLKTFWWRYWHMPSTGPAVTASEA